MLRVGITGGIGSGKSFVCKKIEALGFPVYYCDDEAKRLMREHPEMNMLDVAEQCGFSSPTVFARVFARETGMSPKEWSANN